MRQHLAFRNFPVPVITAANDLFDAKPWRVDEPEVALDLFQNFLNAGCAAYDARPVELTVGSMFRGSVQYTPAVIETSALTDEEEVISGAKVRVRKTSILLVFRALREHLIRSGAVEGTTGDPFSWACSLFYTVRPIMFRARVREGRIRGVNAQDTYSSASWSLLVAAGLVVGSRLIGTKEQWAAAIAGEPIPEAAPATSAGAATLSEDDLADFMGESSDEDEDAFEDDDQPTPEDLADAGMEMTDDERAAVLPSVNEMNRDAIRRLAAEHNVPGRGTLNRTELADRLIVMGLAR